MPCISFGQTFRVRLPYRVKRLSSLGKKALIIFLEPNQSQLGAWASCQSSEVANRDELEQDFLACERKFEGSEIPIPPDWGGYLVVPEFYEFWQGRPGRLHDRFVYEPDGFGGWTVTRLFLEPNSYGSGFLIIVAFMVSMPDRRTPSKLVPGLFGCP